MFEKLIFCLWHYIILTSCNKVSIEYLCYLSPTIRRRNKDRLRALCVRYRTETPGQSHRWPWQYHRTHRWPCMVNTCPPGRKVRSRLFKIPAIAICGPPVENLWPLIETFGHWWKLTIFEKITCRKKWKKNYNFAGKLAITYSGKAITQSKVPNSTIFEDINDGLVSNDAAG